MAGWENLIPQYKQYGGPGHTGNAFGWNPFSGENRSREFVKQPVDALDWVFFWHGHQGGQVLYFNMFAFVLLTIGLLAYVLRNPIE
jgi:hypothetical protein